MIQARAAVWLGLAGCLVACNPHLGYWEPSHRDASVAPPDRPAPDSETSHDGHDRAPPAIDPAPDRADDAPTLPPSAAPPPPPAGARCEVAAVEPCQLPSGAILPSEATAEMPGVTDWFSDGIPLPPGDYRLEYVGGCMTYEIAGVPPVFGWSVHTNTADNVLGTSAAWLVTEAEALVALTPGSEGIVAGMGAFATQAECVAFNCAMPPLDFPFAGGRLGIRYGAAIPLTYLTGAAQGGIGPTFRLTRREACE